MAWAPDYITDTQLSNWQEIPDNLDDAHIAWAITTASRAVDFTCSDGYTRQFGLVAGAEQRFYTPWWHSGQGRWVVEIDDVQTIVGMVIALDTTGDQTYSTVLTGSRLLPLNAAMKNRPWTRLVLPEDTDASGSLGELRATMRWGWTTVPVAVEQATALQAARFLSRGDSPYGVAGSPETGSELRLLDKVDPDVAVALKDYVRRAVRFG
jgi:hypothetical protein